MADRVCVHTLTTKFEKGNPLSRAKAHIIRDAVASMPTVALITRIMTMETMVELPATDCVAWTKISMKGYAVGVACPAG